MCGIKHAIINLIVTEAMVYIISLYLLDSVDIERESLLLLFLSLFTDESSLSSLDSTFLLFQVSC